MTAAQQAFNEAAARAQRAYEDAYKEAFDNNTGRSWGKHVNPRMRPPVPPWKTLHDAIRRARETLNNVVKEEK